MHELLKRLDEEREKFCQADTEKMQALIDELVRIGIYPKSTPMIEGGMTHLRMVESWGVDWHIWKGHLNCPACGSDWRDLVHGPPGKREIGVVSLDLDRLVGWHCPDCGADFDVNFVKIVKEKVDWNQGF